VTGLHKVIAKSIDVGNHSTLVRDQEGLLFFSPVCFFFFFLFLSYFLTLRVGKIYEQKEFDAPFEYVQVISGKFSSTLFYKYIVLILFLFFFFF
jgi:hypothetical protein